MKFYDAIISLGQYCVTSTALSRCHLRKESLPFDWSAGILPEAGRLGLEVKVKLIANDFQDFFNFEDFENRGNNQENDVQNLWIVNKRTGLQYKHDFSSVSSFESQFETVKEKYMRRVKRLYEKIEKARCPLFLFIARDEGLTDGLLFKQKEILKGKYPKKDITFLYILHDPYYSEKEYSIDWIDKDICKIICNVTYSKESYPESWNGNIELYYKLLKHFVRTPKFINRLFSKSGKRIMKIKKI